MLRDAEVGVQRLEADARRAGRGVLLRRPAAADQDRSRRGLLQGQALAGEVDEVAQQRHHGLCHVCLERPALDRQRHSDERRDVAGCGSRAVEDALALDRSAGGLQPEPARRLLDRVQLDPDRQPRAVRRGGAREHGRREQRVRLALERTEEAAAHRRREIGRDAAEIGSREELDLEAGRAFDRRLPLHRSEVRLGVGGEQAAGQLDLQIDAELRR